MSAVPSGFVDLFAASSRLSTQVDVIGVVTDIMPPSRSKGTDWICTFSIADSTFGGDYDQGLKIRFFKPTESELPKIQGTGDVIVLRSMKITQWSGTTMAISNRHSTWTIFPASSIPERAPSNNIQLKHIKEARATIPSPEIMLYATCLCNARDRSSFSEPISKPQTLPQAMSANTSPSAANSITPAPHSRRDKFSLIKDVVIDVFYDVVGQVVKIFPSNGCVELYITDYTSNNLLYNYEWGQDDSEAISRDGDDYGYVPRASSRRQWPGPFGKMTMTVTLWPPHSYFANGNVKELDFVHLRNMRVKNNKDVKMEGSLHSDKLWPDRVDVMILKDNREDDRVKDVLRRKLEYTKRFKSQSQAFVEEVRGQKRKATGDDKPLSKAQAKKRRKQEMEKLAEAKRQEALNIKKPHGKENTTIDSKRNEGHDGRHQTPDTSPPPARPPKLELNKNGKPTHRAHSQTPNSLTNTLISQSNAPIQPFPPAPFHPSSPSPPTPSPPPTAPPIPSLSKTSNAAPLPASSTSSPRTSQTSPFGPANLPNSTSCLTKRTVVAGAAEEIPRTKTPKKTTSNGNGASHSSSKKPAPRYPKA